MLSTFELRAPSAIPADFRWMSFKGCIECDRIVPGSSVAFACTRRVIFCATESGLALGRSKAKTVKLVEAQSLCALRLEFSSFKNVAIDITLVNEKLEF